MLVYSDGISEAMNPQGDLLGHQALTEILMAHQDLPLHELLDRIVARVHDHAAGAPQSDDITLVAVRRSISSGSPLANKPFLS